MPLSILGLAFGIGLIGLFASLSGATAPARAELGMACSSKVMPLRPPMLSPLGVAVTNSSDAWTVGYAIDGYNERAVIEHWDGTSWRVAQRLPDGSSFEAVAAVAPDDVWAVGLATGRTLAEHWDGTSWMEVPVPGPPNVLRAVSAFSTDDMWAVGASGLRAHWDGSAWKLIPGPNETADLLAVSMASASDVWDAGYKPVGELVHPVSDHWDGARWSGFPVPFPGEDGLLKDVVTSGGDVWGLGGYAGPPLIYHWEGTAWRIAYTFPEGIILDALVARSSTDIWAVGTSIDAGGTPAVFRYDGSSWKRVPTPPTLTGGLTAVAWDQISGDVWAVGVDGTKLYSLQFSCS